MKLDAHEIVTTITRYPNSSQRSQFKGLHLVCLVSDSKRAERFRMFLKCADFEERASPDIIATNEANPLILTVALKDVASPAVGRHVFEIEFEHGKREHLCAVDVLEIPRLNTMYA